MQRLHEDDLTGHLLDKLPAPARLRITSTCACRPNTNLSATSPAWAALTRAPSPANCSGPPALAPAENAAAKLDLGARAYAGQHAQRPAPAGGSIYQVEWWQGRNRYATRTASNVIARWLSWDTAFKDSEQNDTSALTVCELLGDYRLFLRHASWQRLQFPQLASAITAEARRWMADGKLRGILIEDKASGISVLQTLRQGAPPEIAALLQAFSPGQLSKAARARQASLWCERGCVLLPQPSDEVPWLFDFEDLLYKFPAAKINDPIDAFTQAILYLENLLAEGWRASHPVETLHATSSARNDYAANLQTFLPIRQPFHAQNHHIPNRYPRCCSYSEGAGESDRTVHDGQGCSSIQAQNARAY